MRGCFLKWIIPGGATILPLPRVIVERRVCRRPRRERDRGTDGSPTKHVQTFFRAVDDEIDDELDATSDRHLEEDSMTDTTDDEEALTREDHGDGFNPFGKHTEHGYRNLIKLPVLRKWSHRQQQQIEDRDTSASVLLDSPRSVTIALQHGWSVVDFHVSEEPVVERQRQIHIARLVKKYRRLCKQVSQQQCIQLLLGNPTTSPRNDALDESPHMTTVAISPLVQEKSRRSASLSQTYPMKQQSSVLRRFHRHDKLLSTEWERQRLLLKDRLTRHAHALNAVQNERNKRVERARLMQIGGAWRERAFRDSAQQEKIKKVRCCSTCSSRTYNSDETDSSENMDDDGHTAATDSVHDPTKQLDWQSESPLDRSGQDQLIEAGGDFVRMPTTTLVKQEKPTTTDVMIHFTVQGGVQLQKNPMDIVRENNQRREERRRQQMVQRLQHKKMHMEQSMLRIEAERKERSSVSRSALQAVAQQNERTVRLRELRELELIARSDAKEAAHLATTLDKEKLRLAKRTHAQMVQLAESRARAVMQRSELSMDKDLFSVDRTLKTVDDLYSRAVLLPLTRQVRREHKVQPAVLQPTRFLHQPPAGKAHMYLH